MPTAESPLASSPALTLVVRYRTPSLNITKRQHWAAQLKEKKRAWDALELALLAIGSDCSIPTTSPEVSKTCSTAFATLVSFRMTPRIKSSSKQPKKR